jgi:hypothetical protein
MASHTNANQYFPVSGVPEDRWTSPQIDNTNSNQLFPVQQAGWTSPNRNTNPFLQESTMRTDALGFRRRERIPDRFDGQKPWRDYWAHFTACWEINDWDDEYAALVLASCLSGSACKVMTPKPTDSRGKTRKFTIEELRIRLDRRYGPGQLADTFLMQLKSRKRNPKETLQELGEAIRELVTQAYPEAPKVMQERLAKDQFREALDDGEVRAAIHRAHPDTLDAAVEAGLEAEQFQRSEMKRGRGRMMNVGSVSQPKSDPLPDHTNDQTLDDHNKLEERLKKMEKCQHDMIQMLSDKLSVSKKQPGPVQCYRCGELGHISRNCSQSMNTTEDRQCYNCRQFGHIRRDCPQPQLQHPQENYFRPHPRGRGRPVDRAPNPPTN